MDDLRFWLCINTIGATAIIMVVFMCFGDMDKNRQKNLELAKIGFSTQEIYCLDELHGDQDSVAALLCKDLFDATEFVAMEQRMSMVSDD